MVSSPCFQLMCVYVSRLLSVSVYFTLKTINLQTVRHHELPDCYDFHIMVSDDVFGSCSAVVIVTLLVKYCGWEHLFCAQILFNNRAHSGKITVDVGTDVRIYECRDWSVEGTCKIYLQSAISSDPTVQHNHSNWFAGVWLSFDSWQKRLPPPVIWLRSYIGLLCLSHPLLAIHHQRRPASNCEWDKSLKSSHHS